MLSAISANLEKTNPPQFVSPVLVQAEKEKEKERVTQQWGTRMRGE